MLQRLAEAGGVKGRVMLSAPVIRQIAPQFFTTEMAATLAYYKDKLGFDSRLQLRRG
jgi:hypothetical protein